MTTITPDPGDAALLQRLCKQQEALIAIGRLWRSYDGDLQQLFRDTTEIAARALSVERVGVWQYDPETRSIQCTELYEATAGSHSEGPQATAEQYPAYFLALEAEEAIAAEDAHSDPRTCEFSESYLTPLGIVAMLDIPIHAGGKLFGVLSHEHVGKSREFHADEVNTATYLANMLGAAVEYNLRQDENRKVAELLTDEVTVWRILVEQSRDGIVIINQQGGVHEVNQRFAAMLGYSMEEMAQHHVWDWEINQSKDQILEMISAVDASGEHFETRHRRKDGSEIDVEISSNAAIYKGKKLIFCIVRDITERKEAEEKLRRSEERLQRIASQVPGALYQFRLAPDGTRSMPYFSDGIIALGGITAAELAGDPDVITSMLLPEDVDGFEASIQESARTLQPWNHEFRIHHRNGSVRWISGNSVPQQEADGSLLWHGILLDVTERKLAEEKIRVLATTDGLTGIANRTEFTRILQMEIARVKRHGNTLSVIMYDLDRFKRVNDTYGHDAGDRVLQEVTKVVNDNIRNIDTAGRWGGEEFMVLLPQSGRTAAAQTAERLRKAIEQHSFNGIGTLTCSFGVSEIDKQDDIHTLLKRVDNALYQAKNNGRNRVEVA